jgi:cytochrome c oxidase cbb3-type subunit 2
MSDPAANSAAPLRPWLTAAALVAATYFYFLLFAEFALLELAAPLAASPSDLRVLMGALGAGGIAGSLLGAAVFRTAHAAPLLAWTLRVCAIAALLAPFARDRISFFAVSGAVGLSLGALTVFLASSLRALAGPGRLGLCAGLGTGLAYAACNLPALFAAAPRTQALAAAVVAVLASFAAARTRPQFAAPPPTPDTTGLGAARWVVLLAALVWMDSAAFYIIQHTDHLRAATWAGAWTLYGNSATHLGAAVLVGLVLDRGARARTLVVAFAALAAACLALNGTLPFPALAAILYTAGVSVYSVVLVHYPAHAARPWLAGAVFAVAGWIGSALGIGMAQDLARIPNAFVVAAAPAHGAPLPWRRHGSARSLPSALAPALLVFLLAAPLLPAAAAAADPGAAIARGREVYIAEGCLHCHSQYVRPRVAADLERWGPAATLEAVLAAPPPLLGNRRQGPDLANVGLRRSAEWHRLHLLAPRDLAPGSRMPTYAHLFAPGDERGDALVAYLASLGASARGERDAFIARWQPAVPFPPPAAPSPSTASRSPVAAAVAPSTPAAPTVSLSATETHRLFARTCAPCHGPTGRGDGPVAARLALPPPDWPAPGWRRLAATPAAERDLAAARIIKFGLPGTPMPGHEALPDSAVVALVAHVRSLQKPAPAPTLADLGRPVSPRR